MKTNQLGTRGPNISRVGFGTWSMGGAGWAYSWGPQDDEESIAAIVRACHLGVNWIDTAPVYGLGHCEEVVGRALKEMSEKPLVATKCGSVWDDDGAVTCRLNAQSIRREAEESLRRLGVETIDLYQIHWPNDEPHIEEAWEMIQTLIAEGKVRWGGVSNFSVEHLERIVAIAPPVSLQPHYNMLDRKIEGRLLDYCSKAGIGVISYGPMAKGLLTGKFNPERVAGLAADDHRRRDRDFQEPKLTQTLELIEKLRPIAEKNNKTHAQLAIAWVLRRSEVSAAIVGARRPDQIEETALAGDWDLSDEDQAAIEALLCSP